MYGKMQVFTSDSQYLQILYKLIFMSAEKTSKNVEKILWKTSAVYFSQSTCRHCGETSEFVSATVWRLHEKILNGNLNKWALKKKTWRRQRGDILTWITLRFLYMPEKQVGFAAALNIAPTLNKSRALQAGFF